MRSATLAFYDREVNDGIHHFGGTRPACGDASLFGALGLAIQSEGSPHCTCAYNFQRASLALAPTDRRPNEDWSIYFDRSIEFGSYLAPTAINLGAPGDRRDEDGPLWMGYPREMAVRRGKAHTLPIVMDRDERFDALRINTDFTPVANTDRPWIYGTALTGMRRLNLDMFFRHPDKEAVSTAVSRPPRQDGVLADDDIWDGSRSVELRQQDEVEFRHDDEHLYVAYQRHAVIDRRGTVTPWRISSEEEALEIWDEDRFELRISPQITTPARERDKDRRDTLCLAVTVSGKQHAGLWRPDRLEEDDIWSQDPWQSDWSSRIAVSDERFACEVRIPWQDLERIGFDRNKLMVELNQTPLPAEKGRDFPGTWRQFTAAHFRNLRLDDTTPEPRTYTVRLHFAELDETVRAGDRVFDVAIQGKTVLRGLDVLAETGGHRRAMVPEVRGITTKRSLDIMFTPHAETLTSTNTPILNGLEIEEEMPPE